MKNIILILILFLNSCFSNISIGQAMGNVKTETTSTAVEFRSLENNFIAPVERLPAQQIKLFQKKSEQQVEDLIALIDLMYSKTWKEPFKTKLYDQAISTFTSPTDSLFLLEGNNLKGISIADFLKDLKSKSYSTVKIIKTTTPTLENNIYTWNVTFEIKEEKVLKNKFIAKCILKQNKKAFGKIEKMVWDVFIQEIKEISK